MAQDTPQSTDIATRATTPPADPGRSSRKKRAPAPLVRCGVCGERYRRLSRHVRSSHGLTPAQYTRCFDHATPDIAPSASHTGNNDASTPAGHLVRQLAERCASSPDFLDRIASDVGAHLLGSGLRIQLAASLGALLETRMRLAGQAAALLARVDDEMSAPWRVEAGGEMGAPTSTRDLATIHAAASAELDRATDAVLRASKLAIDERRGERGEAAGDAPLDRYRGTRDALPLADTLGPGERAIMQALLERLAARAQAERTIIDARAVPAPTDEADAHHFD